MDQSVACVTEDHLLVSFPSTALLVHRYILPFAHNISQGIIWSSFVQGSINTSSISRSALSDVVSGGVTSGLFLL